MNGKLNTLVEQYKIDLTKCFFGHQIDVGNAYLAFIDGCASQVVCYDCAEEVDSIPFGMNATIGKFGSDEVEDYIREFWIKPQSNSSSRRAYLRTIINAVKSSGCSDCGNKTNTDSLTFDHLPKYEKLGDINDFVRNKSRRKLLIEMAKCDVVCRDCHDKRERKRGRMFQNQADKSNPN